VSWRLLIVVNLDERCHQNSVLRLQGCGVRCGRSEAKLAASNGDGGGADSAKRGGGVGAVAGGGNVARVDTLPVYPLVIQSGQTEAVAPIRVDGDDYVLDGICSEVRTGDMVVNAGIPKPKSMVAPEKGLADAAGDGKGTTMGALVDTVSAAGAGVDNDIMVATPRLTDFADVTGMGATAKGVMDARGTGADGSGVAGGDGADGGGGVDSDGR
jgi:hypothetical protein